MTLPRTIHRREARKRARDRVERWRVSPAGVFFNEQITRMTLGVLAERLTLASVINRQYDDPTAIIQVRRR